MALDPRYHIRLADPVSGEWLGLYLLASPRPLAFQSASPMAVRSVDSKDYSTFDQWSELQQLSYHRGNGLDMWVKTDPERFRDSDRVDTRIRDQLTLAPAITEATVGGSSFAPALGTSAEWEITIAGPRSVFKQEFETITTTPINRIALRLRRDTPAFGNIEIYVRENFGGEDIISRGVVDAATFSYTMGWVTISLEPTVRAAASPMLLLGTASGASLTATTHYHVEISRTAGSFGTVYLGATQQDTYADGTSYVWSYGSYYRTGSYGAMPYGTMAYGVDGDIFFMLLDESELIGDPVTMCYFYNASRVFLAAGEIVYYWDEALFRWIADKNFHIPITDLANYANLLWTAVDSTLWTRNGAGIWTDKALEAEQLHVWRGYLYRSYFNAVSGDNEVYWTGDGATWYGPWVIGHAGRGERITGIAGYQDEVYVATSHGIYALGVDVAFRARQQSTWDTQHSLDNGKGIFTWPRDGSCYLPLGNGLMRFDPANLASVGPEREAGLLETKTGKIKSITGTLNWLIAAVDAGTGRSTVQVTNAPGTGWHELIQSEVLNEPCYLVFYDTSVTPCRLWFNYGRHMGYIELPDTTDNRYQYQGSTYVSQGELYTPWIANELLMVDKDFHSVSVKGDFPVGTWVGVDYQVDRSDAWRPLYLMSGGQYLGNGANYGKFAFAFDVAFALEPVVLTGSSTKSILVSGDLLDDLYATKWIRIGKETRQIEAVGDTGFTVVQPFTDTPVAGARVYPSRPVGKEICLRLNLFSNSTSLTPKVNAWWLKSMPMLEDYEAGSFEVILTDYRQNANGATEPQDALGAANLLRSYAERRTPVWLYDPTGERYTIKITRLSRRINRFSGGAQTKEPGFELVYTLAFVEVDEGLMMETEFGVASPVYGGPD